MVLLVVFIVDAIVILLLCCSVLVFHAYSILFLVFWALVLVAASGVGLQFKPTQCTHNVAAMTMHLATRRYFNIASESILISP